MALTSQQLDDLIDSLYLNKTGSGELRHLSALFNGNFSSGLQALLNKNFVRTQGPYKQRVEVKIGYIDKIPVAEFSPPINDIWGHNITEKTEIGDAAVFFIDTYILPNGTEQVRQASALILQAKEAENNSLPKNVPIVKLPKTRNDSTLKELALLTDWPTFNLYFTGSSHIPLQNGYEINNRSGLTQPQGWYIGAPPTLKSNWKPHWIAGPSSNGAPCDHSIGKLLHAIFTNQGNLDGTEGVGQKFNYDVTRLTTTTPQNPHQLASHSTPPNWDDLCHQILLACNKYDLPKSLFSNAKGIGRTKTTTAIYSNPIGPIFSFVSSIVSHLRNLFFKDKTRRFPVLVVVRQSTENNHF